MPQKPEHHSSLRVTGALTNFVLFEYSWTVAETSTGIVASKAMRMTRERMRKERVKGRSARVAWASIHIELRDGPFTEEED